VPTDETVVALVTDSLVEVVRKELPPLLRSGKNWKFIFNGSAGGDVRTAIELHAEVVRRFQSVSEPE
jgi:hypothetical protein